jgi:nucleoid DNA-binding protein
MLDQVPLEIRAHLEGITRTSGLPPGEDSLEMIAGAWVRKKQRFEEQIASLHMLPVAGLGRDEPRGALLLTYSGSLISVGAPGAETRWAEYASIGLRRDVPRIAKTDRAVLETDIRVGAPLAFASGPVKQSSPILQIAVCGEEVDPEEQQRRIREATAFLAEEFVRINRTCIIPREGLPERFTMDGMVRLVAAENGVPVAEARKVIESFLELARQGVLGGHRVPLGGLGRLFLKRRAMSRARLGRNPATGEEITIGAKPERLVPGFNPSRGLQEDASRIDPASMPGDQS